MILGGMGRSKSAFAATSGIRKHAREKAKNFLTGKGKKKKDKKKSRRGLSKEVTAVVVAGSSSLSITKNVDKTSSAIVPYVPPGALAKRESGGEDTYERLSRRLKNIVSLTETLDALTKKSYENKKKSVKRREKARKKAKKRFTEGALEKGGKVFLGLKSASDAVKEITGGFDLGEYIQNIILGGVLGGALDLMQKFGVRKGLSILTERFRDILYGFRILKGALRSVASLAWTGTKFAFGMIRIGLEDLGGAILRLGDDIWKGVVTVGDEIVKFVRGVYRTGAEWAKSVVNKGRKLLGIANTTSDAVKTARTASNVANTASDAVKTARTASNVAGGVSDAVKTGRTALNVAGGVSDATRLSRTGLVLTQALSSSRALYENPTLMRKLGFASGPLSVILGPLLSIGAGLLDPDVTVGRALMRGLGTFVGEALGTLLAYTLTGMIGASTGGVGFFAGLLLEPLLSAGGGYLGEYLGDALYLLAFGGGWEALSQKMAKDWNNTIEAAFNVGEWVQNGLGKFYHGMPKWELSPFIIKGIDMLTPGFDAKKLNGLIPDLGWWINPLTTAEKGKLFVESFFSKDENKKPPEGDKEKRRMSDEEVRKKMMGSTSIVEEEEEEDEEDGRKPRSVTIKPSGDIAPGPGAGNIPNTGGMETAEAIYQQLVSDGIPPAAAAGIVGNIGAESNFDPAAIEAATGEGRGLIQWTGTRRTAFENWSRENDLDPDSMEANYRYLLYEMKGGDGNHWSPRSGTPKHLQVHSYEEFLEKATTPELAAELYMLNYERPAPATQHLGRRQDYASNVYSAASQSSQESKAQVGETSGTFASGLRTGPSARIGGSDDYHIDTKFDSSLPMEQKIAMMDAMSRTYASEGKIIEFSNPAVANETYSHTMSYEEKVKLLNRAIAAHSHSRHEGLDSIDYYVPSEKDSRETGGRGRFRSSAEQAQIHLPKPEGGKATYHTSPGYGRSVNVYDSKGNLVLITGHGDDRTSANRGTVAFGRSRSRRGTTDAITPESVASTQKPEISQLTPQAQGASRKAIPSSTHRAQTAQMKKNVKINFSGIERFTDYEVEGGVGGAIIPIPVGGGGKKVVPSPAPLPDLGGPSPAETTNDLWKKWMQSILYKQG